MTPTVFIIGTSHAYQFGEGVVTREATCSPEDAVLFRNLLISECEQHRIRSIGEEMSIDALSKNKRTESIPKIVAASLAVPHCYCDPSLVEQEVLGIQNENGIRYGKLLGKPHKSPDEIEQEIIANRRKREPYWLNHLNHLSTWPTLFVCGAWHVPSFSSLLREAGVLVTAVMAFYELNEKQATFKDLQISAKLGHKDVQEYLRSVGVQW